MQLMGFFEKCWRIIVVMMALSMASTHCLAVQPVHSATPDFGPNVLIFDPSMPEQQVQQKLDHLFSLQQSNQFGRNRYAVLFKPGSYHVAVKVGFYTQLLGLGLTPDAVTLDGGVEVNAAWFESDATQNFWRGVENLAVIPASGTMKWAVSQASPARRLHVKGNMVLDDNGWSSGGFLADSLVDGEVDSGIQQQWLSRNTRLGSWKSSNWNMVFVGVEHAPSGKYWPNPAYTVIENTPVIREKPFLTINAQGQYSVFVPALTRNSQGASWHNGAAAGLSIPISQFYIAKAGVDTAASINAALAQGKHLLFTPGIYALENTLHVTHANTVVLGLGLATLQPMMGLPAMQVDDVDGVKLAGILFDAGLKTSPYLLQIGTSNSQQSHADNPTSLHDLFFRVGGAAEGNAKLGLVINSYHVIGDDLWIWRADHGTGVGWTDNNTRNGLVVNGNEVTIYGLAVEHFHQYQTVWNGDRGAVYFYQSELPYDVPDQASWMNGDVNGFASYKVADTVTSHQAWGVGIYCYFNENPSVKLHRAIEAPPLDMFHDMTTVSLGGTGEITHVINNMGDAANAQQPVSRLAK